MDKSKASYLVNSIAGASIGIIGAIGIGVAIDMDGDYGTKTYVLLLSYGLLYIFWQIVKNLKKPKTKEVGK